MLYLNLWETELIGLMTQDERWNTSYNEVLYKEDELYPIQHVDRANPIRMVARAFF